MLDTGRRKTEDGRQENRKSGDQGIRIIGYQENIGNGEFRIGLENVIFPLQSRISGEKKHLVLLISQKDYVHIKKYEVWDKDSGLGNLELGGCWMRDDGGQKTEDGGRMVSS